MKLVVGLGNTGERYAKTRHNVGFMVIDAIISSLSVSPHVEKKLDSLIFFHHASQTVFARPQTFMNFSGVVVKKLVVHFKIKKSDMWAIHDDLDLTLGAYKIQKSVGPKVHGGLLSIYDKLGTRDFWHVRVGVDNRNSDDRISGEQYVLQEFPREELEKINIISEEIVKDLITRLSLTVY